MRAGCCVRVSAVVAHLDAAHALFIISSACDGRCVVELQALACSPCFLAPFKGLEKSWRLSVEVKCVCSFYIIKLKECLEY